MFGIGVITVFWILVVVFIVGLTFWVNDFKFTFDAVVLSVFLPFMGLLFYCVSTVMVYSNYIGHDDNTYKNTKVAEYNIKSLKPMNGVNGSFFLGSGSISGSGYFYTLVEIEEGILQKQKYSINDTFLSETGNHKIVEYKKTYYNKRYTWLTGKESVYSREWYMIEVPKGTIIEEYQAM